MTLPELVSRMAKYPNWRNQDSLTLSKKHIDWCYVLCIIKDKLTIYNGMKKLHLMNKEFDFGS